MANLYSVNDDNTLVIGVDNTYTDIQVYDETEKLEASNLNFFTAFIGKHFVPPPEDQVPFGYEPNYFYHSREGAENRDWWRQYAVAKLNTNLGKAGQSRLRTEQRMSYLYKTLHYLRKIPLRAFIIPLRHRDTYDLSEVLESMSCGEDALPAWIKVSIDKVSKARIQRQKRILNAVKKRIKAEKDSNEEEEHDEEEDIQINPKTEAQKTYDDEIWKWWSKLYARTKFQKKIGVVLEFNDRLPDDYLIDRWISEPVTFIIIPVHVFIEKRGLPVLNYVWKNFISIMVHYTNCGIMIKRPSSGFHRHPIKAYTKYLQSVWTWHCRREIRKFKRNHTRVLSIRECIHPAATPLFNRCNESYVDRDTRTFYRNAFLQVLQEKRAQKSRAKFLSTQSAHSTKTECDDDIIRIAVISARCEVLVDEIINAASMLGIEIKVHVFVKCSSLITKEDIGRQHKWSDDDVFMFSTYAPTPCLNPKCDVVVFDCFGFWTGTTVTPDIIKNANNILCEDCMVVPCQFFGTLTPISSPKMWAWAKSAGKVSYFDEGEENLDDVYECYMKNMVELGETKSVLHEQPLRYQQAAREPEQVGDRPLSWKMNMAGVVHGFSGNFFTKLSVPCKVAGVEDSITTMHSRYYTPIFIPLMQPLRVRKDKELHAMFKRHVSNNSVWYDWQVKTHSYSSQIHNSIRQTTALADLFEPFR